MRVGFFNAAGLANKHTAITDIMNELNCKTTLITETKQHAFQNSTSHPFIAASSRPPSIRAGVPTKHGVALFAHDDLWGTWRDEITVQATDNEGQYLIWTHHGIQFIGLYLPPSTDATSLITANTILNNAMRAAEKRPKPYRVILGDLNIRMEPDSLHISSSYHKALLESLRNFGFTRVPMTEGRFTFFGRGGGETRSILDHAFTNEEAKILHPSVTSLDKPHQRTHNSDHCFLYLDIDKPDGTATKEDTSEYWGYNTAKLHHEDVAERFNQSYVLMTGGLTDDVLFDVASTNNRRFDPPNIQYGERWWRPEPIDAQAYIDYLESLVLGPLIQTAEDVLGRNPRKGRRIPPVRPSARLAELYARKHDLIEVCRRTNIEEFTSDQYVALNELSSDIEDDC
jgi:hypothetical protein